MDGLESAMMLAFGGSINKLLLSMESIIPQLLKEASQAFQDIANIIKQCVKHIKEAIVKGFNILIKVIKKCLTMIKDAVVTAIKWISSRICKILSKLLGFIDLVLETLVTALPVVAQVHSCMALVGIFSSRKAIDAKNYNEKLTRTEQNIKRIFNKLLDTCEEAAMEDEYSRRINEGEKYRRKINLICLDLDYEVKELGHLEMRIKDDLKKVETEKDKTVHSAPVKLTAGGTIVVAAACIAGAPAAAFAAVLWGAGTALDVGSYWKSDNKKSQLENYLNRAETARDDSRKIRRLQEKSEIYIAGNYMGELNDLVQEYRQH